MLLEIGTPRITDRDFSGSNYCFGERTIDLRAVVESCHSYENGVVRHETAKKFKR